MGFHIPSRAFNPRLFEPGIKPVGELEINPRSSISKNLKFFGLVVEGGMFDVVKQRLYPLPNAVIRSHHNMGLVAEYNVTTDVVPIEPVYIRSANRKVTYATISTRVSDAGDFEAQINHFHRNGGADWYFGHYYYWATTYPRTNWRGDHNSIVTVGGDTSLGYNDRAINSITAHNIRGGTLARQSDAYTNNVYSIDDATLYGSQFDFYDELLFNRNTTGTAVGHTATSMMALWDAEWSAAQHRSWQNDPYQVVRLKRGGF